MEGFKNTTKMKSGHGSSRKEACPDYASGSRNVFAAGGIVAPMGGSRMPGMGGPRPIMPRPRVMPNVQTARMHSPMKLASGGKVGRDGGGGPYNGSPEGNSLEMANRPYSKIEQEHPRSNVRPGYAFGGIKKGALHKDMGIPQGQKIPVSKIRSKLKKDKAHGNATGVKRDVFAINAKTKFADGGMVDCDEPQMEQVAQKVVNRHVASKPPQGHGVKPKGNLAFMRKPMFGKS